MVASGDERGPRRRAQRGGVNVVVAKTVLRDAIHCRCRDDAAEGARYAKAGIIRDDEQHVGRFLGRHDARRPPRFRLQGIVLDHAAEFRIGRRKLLAADGGCGAGRARRAGSLQLARLIVVFIGRCLTGFALGLFCKCLIHNWNARHHHQNDENITEFLLFHGIFLSIRWIVVLHRLAANLLYGKHDVKIVPVVT